VRDHPRVEATKIQAAFDNVFDQSVVFHSFADYMRDYDVFVYADADPRAGAGPRHLRYRFRHCVRAAVTTALSPQIWQRSLDDRLIHPEQSRELDGHSWGIRWQALYPGMKLAADSAEAARWSRELGVTFHEVEIQTNVQNISLVFSDLTVDALETGYAPFMVQGPAPGR